MKNTMMWQQISYKELFDLCYSCGLLGRILKSYNCAKIQEPKQVYGFWIHVARVPISPGATNDL